MQTGLMPSFDRQASPGFGQAPARVKPNPLFGAHSNCVPVSTAGTRAWDFCYFSDSGPVHSYWTAVWSCWTVINRIWRFRRFVRTRCTSGTARLGRWSLHLRSFTLIADDAPHPDLYW